MITSILVPLDGSSEAEQAIPYAQALLPDEGEIILFRAVPELEPFLTELSWTLDATGESIEMATARTELERLKPRLAEAHLRWTVDVACGDPATHILRDVEEKGVGLIAMTTHGRGAIDRTIFGSVADRIARTSPVPVLLVRPQRTQTVADKADIRRLLVPLDGSELAEEALPLVEELARRLTIPVHLVRAINFAATLAALTDGGMLAVAPSPELYDQAIADLRTAAGTYLSAAAARLTAREIQTTWRVLDGSPFLEIIAAVELGDLLVMTSHGRGGVLRWLLGSVAEKLVREAPAPVLLVPAAGRGHENAISASEAR